MHWIKYINFLFLLAIIPSVQAIKKPKKGTLHSLQRQTKRHNRSTNKHSNKKLIWPAIAVPTALIIIYIATKSSKNTNTSTSFSSQEAQAKSGSEKKHETQLQTLLTKITPKECKELADSLFPYTAQKKNEFLNISKTKPFTFNAKNKKDIASNIATLLAVLIQETFTLFIKDLPNTEEYHGTMFKQLCKSGVDKEDILSNFRKILESFPDLKERVKKEFPIKHPWSSRDSLTINGTKIDLSYEIVDNVKESILNSIQLKYPESLKINKEKFLSELAIWRSTEIKCFCQSIQQADLEKMIQKNKFQFIKGIFFNWGSLPQHFKNALAGETNNLRLIMADLLPLLKSTTNDLLLNLSFHTIAYCHYVGKTYPHYLSRSETLQNQYLEKIKTNYAKAIICMQEKGYISHSSPK